MGYTPNISRKSYLIGNMMIIGGSLFSDYPFEPISSHETSCKPW